MSAWRSVAAWMSRWVEDVAVALTRFASLFRMSRKVRLVEQGDGGFVMTRGGLSARPIGKPLHIEDAQIIGPVPQMLRGLLAGSQIDLVLKSSHFIFRSLELPARASEFLDGVVRAQIDRLTPWSPSEAVFG